MAKIAITFGLRLYKIHILALAQKLSQKIAQLFACDMFPVLSFKVFSKGFGSERAYCL